MMRMFGRRVAITVAVVGLCLIALVMLKRRGVIVIVVIEATVRIHNDAARLVQRRVRHVVMMMM